MDGQIHGHIIELTQAANMHIIISSAFLTRQMMEDARRAIFTVGASLSGILALIGLFNFVNVLSVGLLTRKREFAALESVGMSKNQMRSMLRFEGAVYWVFIISAVSTLGTAAAYGLFQLIHQQDPTQYPSFVYPFLPVLLVFGSIVIICSIAPELAYRSISKSSLVERLREAE